MKDKENILIDASSIVNMLPYLVAEKVKDNKKVQLNILELTPFEVNNALWKLYIRKILELEEAKKLSNLFQLFIDHDIFKIIRIKDYRNIFDLATRIKTNFYDSAYIYVAREYSAILVTDDKGLEAHAKTRKIDAITTQKFMKKYKSLFSY